MLAPVCYWGHVDVVVGPSVRIATNSTGVVPTVYITRIEVVGKRIKTDNCACYIGISCNAANVPCCKTRLVFNPY